MRRNAPKLLIPIAAAALTLLILMLLPPPLEASPLAQSGPDLIVSSISVDPAFPEPNETCTVTLVVKNQGNAAASQVYYHLYIDPADDPPTTTTQHTYWSYLFSLPAGGSTGFDYPHIFTTTGCDHVAYGWVDKNDVVDELDETNNILSLTVCVGVTCTEDIYEGDDTCAAAAWLTNTQGVAQEHTLCPAEEEDWVKFSAVAGITYTIVATPTGEHADPLVSLHSACTSGFIMGGTGASIEWQCSATGLYYVQVEDGDTLEGPLTEYELAVTADTGGIYDFYEPNDTCATARDIPTDGSTQTHYFVDVDDEDWIKFAVQGGETYVVTADSTASGASALVSLYSSCGQTFAGPLAEGQTVEHDTATGGMLYVKVTNQNPEIHGLDAHYDLAVTTVGCTPDIHEDDDNAQAAHEVATTGVATTHNTCPAGDQDWIKFQAISGTVYVLTTSNLGPNADTQLSLYDTDSTTELAHNDDYVVGLLNSRIVWQAPSTGIYHARASHVKASAAGAETRYDLSVFQGACSLDDHEGGGDNSSLEAVPISTDGTPQGHNMCPQGDQDWVSFEATVLGTTFTIWTSELGGEADTVLTLYGPDGATVLANNDDYTLGGASQITYTATTVGTYYLRVVHYNTNRFGDGTSYELSVTGEIPPTPTPTPTPTATPTPTPTPPPVPPDVHALILVNRERIAALYSESDATQLVAKLYELAAHSEVQGLVVQVELVPSVASAYAAWIADQLDTDKANQVASAIRNLILTNADSNTNLEHILIVGDDRVIPFRRTADYTSKAEDDYAASVTISTTQWAACQDAMSLTDNYYADKEPTTWSKGELYLPDYSVGRLIETPNEMMAFIDAFLDDDSITVSEALVTGYDFVQDGANLIKTLLIADGFSPDTDLIGSSWSGDSLRQRQLETCYEIQSINGHANHTTEIVPVGDSVTASEIATATAGMTGTIIFSVGCHAGLNDPGTLDLAQAFMQKKANYVANTGYGWGGGGVTYSESLMRHYAYELVEGSQTDMGSALQRAKGRYYDQALTFNAYDEKILVESTYYGLPMYTINTGGAFPDEDPFPDMEVTPTLPSGAFGELNQGNLSCTFGGSFGEWTANPLTATMGSHFGEGSFYALNGHVHLAPGEPVQPKFFADVSAPQAGTLRGVLFLGAVYSDVANFDPVIAQPFNEYVTPTIEAEFAEPGWYPAVPFGFRSRPSTLGGTADTVVTLMGQFNSQAGAERVYQSMALDTYYSLSPDTDPPTITYLDGILDQDQGQAAIKVEADDPSGIERIVLSYTAGQGEWATLDLGYDASALKWTGQITSTVDTVYFVQAVDGAGNVVVAHNKGAYYSLAPPAPLIEGEVSRNVHLPLVLKG